MCIPSYVQFIDSGIPELSNSEKSIYDYSQYDSDTITALQSFKFHTNTITGFLRE
jgi:hypothetical protein